MGVLSVSKIIARKLVAMTQSFLHLMVSAEIIRKSELTILQSNSHKWLEILRWQNSSVPDDLYSYITRNLSSSKSQIQQDLFANYIAAKLDSNKSKYFVEFGCTDGLRISNTWLLEKKFGWKGVIAEPARSWHEKLLDNRDCNIELSCVYQESGKLLKFLESQEPEFSTLDQYEKGDEHERVISDSYLVPTISLNDLLEKYDAPKRISFLSIDTEGVNMRF